jgi:hypothetical protein
MHCTNGHEWEGGLYDTELAMGFPPISTDGFRVMTKDGTKIYFCLHCVLAQLMEKCGVVREGGLPIDVKLLVDKQKASNEVLSKLIKFPKEQS